jgi:nuclear transport factor 2 (NTF2) superfamily protein
MTDRDSARKASVEHLEDHTAVQNHRSLQWERDHEYYTANPNRWAYIRNKYLREFASEFLGKQLYCYDTYAHTFIVLIGIHS